MSNNPLQQYFRRPAMYIKLPSGGAYDPSVLEKTERLEYPVYPMTAIDEITSKTPDALMNGQAIVDIIKSCVPNIKNPWQINAVDLDTILIAIKMATNGGNMEINTVCPKCEEPASYELQLSLLLQSINAEGYQKPLSVDGLELVFQSLSYKHMVEASDQQFEIQQQMRAVRATESVEEQAKLANAISMRVAYITMEFVGKSISKIIMPDRTVVSDPEHILEYLKNIERDQYDFIRDHAMSLRESSKTQPLKMKCAHCEHEYDQPLTLNVSDFFG